MKIEELNNKIIKLEYDVRWLWILVIFLLISFCIVANVLPVKKCVYEKQKIVFDKWTVEKDNSYFYTKDDKIIYCEGVTNYNMLYKLINFDMDKSGFCIIEKRVCYIK